MIGIVLAGGKSSRFGQDKALFCQPDKNVNNVELAVSKLAMLCDTVVVCANAKNGSDLSFQFRDQASVNVVVDDPEFAAHGPMSGIYAVTKQHPGQADYLLLAVDYPDLQPAILSRLSTRPDCYAATPDAEHYAIAHFTTSKSALRDYLMLGDNRLSQFLKEACGCLPMTFPSTAEFKNFNTPEDINHVN